jgi:hypothetical protein
MGIASKEFSLYYLTVLGGVMGLKVTNVKFDCVYAANGLGMLLALSKG